MRADLGDERGVAMAEYRFSALRNDQGSYEEAIQRGHRALATFQTHDDQWGNAVVHYELGRSLAGLGRLSEATNAYRIAVVGLDRVGEWQRRAEAAAALSDVQSRTPWAGRTRRRRQPRRDSAAGTRRTASVPRPEQDPAG